MQMQSNLPVVTVSNLSFVNFFHPCTIIVPLLRTSVPITHAQNEHVRVSLLRKRRMPFYRRGSRDGEKGNSFGGILTR